MNLTVFNIDNHPTKPYAEFVDLQRDFKTYSNIPKLAERIRRVGKKRGRKCVRFGKPFEGWRIKPFVRVGLKSAH